MSGYISRDTAAFLLYPSSLLGGNSSAVLSRSCRARAVEQYHLRSIGSPGTAASAVLSFTNALFRTADTICPHLPRSTELDLTSRTPLACSVGKALTTAAAPCRTLCAARMAMTTFPRLGRSSSTSSISRKSTGIWFWF
ncbi:hypothetical protein OH77DRAFT_289411 [Trametes cingulata]|nr:hypothetical protein OH77DRAFT_289411 [Trametes cingulata]